MSNPSVTWPNHTSMVISATPRKHGVLFNGVLERGSMGLPVRVDPKRDKKGPRPHPDDLRHPMATRKGSRRRGSTGPAPATPAPSTSTSRTRRDMFQHSTPSFLASMKRGGAPRRRDPRAGFGKLGPTARDHVWTWKRPVTPITDPQAPLSRSCISSTATPSITATDPRPLGGYAAVGVRRHLHPRSPRPWRAELPGD